MAIITVADIEARTGQTFEDERLVQVKAFVKDVTALVESFLGRKYTTTSPAPDAVKAITCLEVIRYLNTDPGVSSDRVGDLSTGYAYGGAVVVLSRDVREALRPFKARSGIGSIRMITPFYVEPPEEDEE